MIGFKFKCRILTPSVALAALAALAARCNNPLQVRRRAESCLSGEGNGRGRNHRKRKTSFKTTEHDTLNGFPNIQTFFFSYDFRAHSTRQQGLGSLNGWSQELGGRSHQRSIHK